MTAEERLIVALDVPGTREACEVVDRLGARAKWFKVGMGLFTAEGPRVVRELAGMGKQVFLDLKFHDIPAQVALAARSTVGIGAGLVNMHAAAGLEAMKQARAALDEEAAKRNARRPMLIAVTLLTSLEAKDMVRAGAAGAAGALDSAGMVLAMARLAREAGLDGVVSSGHEVAAVKRELGAGFLTVVPGIRPRGASQDDQRRVLTPGEAIREGADFLVIGRPITGARDPVAALDTILEEMETAHASS